jgi:hypothetical protein
VAAKRRNFQRPKDLKSPATEVLRKIEVVGGFPALKVFRFVHSPNVDEDSLARDFRSDDEMGKVPRGRAARIPELQKGLSVFRSLPLARDRWAAIAGHVRRSDINQEIRIGHFIAIVQLNPDQNFAFEDLGQVDGHMTLWGPPKALATSVVEIVPAEG